MLTTTLMMLARSQPVSPETERLGVYVSAAIFGLLVSGIIACAKQMRKEARKND